MALKQAFYECTFIVRHDVSPADVQKLTNEYVQLLTDLKGTLHKNEYWGLRALAYKINKASKGHYVMFGIEAPYDAIAEMERLMRINEDVIRFLTVRVDTMDASPSVMMRSRGGDSSEEAA